MYFCMFTYILFDVYQLHVLCVGFDGCFNEWLKRQTSLNKLNKNYARHTTFRMPAVFTVSLKMLHILWKTSSWKRGIIITSVTKPFNGNFKRQWTHHTSQNVSGKRFFGLTTVFERHNNGKSDERMAAQTVLYHRKMLNSNGKWRRYMRRTKGRSRVTRHSRQ